MASREQLYRALRNADAAGDVEAAKALAAHIQSMPDEPSVAPPGAAPEVDAEPVKTQGSRARAQQQSNGLLTKALLNIIPGAVRGAGSIGVTLLSSPEQLREDVLGSGPGSKPRREAMDQALQSLGADPNDPGYKLGKVGAEVVGTLGVGGATANALSRVAPRAAEAAPGLVNAIRSAGMTTGVARPGIAGAATNALTRASGGAITGGVSAGMVDPGQATTGAAVGAVVPPAMQVTGAVGKSAGGALSRLIEGGQVSSARDLAKALDMTPGQMEQAITALRGAETLVPGASPTVAQALQTPQASILQRVVYDSAGGDALRNKIAQQSAARMSALESVAPTNVGGVAQARHDLGTSVSRQMIPEEERLAAQVRRQFENVDPRRQIRLGLPLEDFQASQDKFLGGGSFGQGSKAQAAVNEARDIGMRPGEPTVRTVLTPTQGGAAKRMPQQVTTPGEMQEAPVSWDEVRRLRTSIGDAWQEAKDKGRSQEAAALNEMRRSLDARIDAASNGAGQAGDVMPREAANAWREANRSYAALQERFHTGPQAGMFRRGGDGQPAKQGGEIASAFWGNRPGLAEDVQSFKRLVDEQPGLMGQFRSLVTTHGAGTADAAGNLTTKYSKWVEQTLPGLREAFSPAEVQVLQRIAKDIDRAASAQKLGTSLGGSNTYQNAQNALSLGMLDSPLLGKAAGMVPGVRVVAAPMLEGVRAAGRNAKAQRLSSLLVDSEAAANALEMLSQQQAAPPNALVRILRDPRTNALVYRGAPVAVSDR